MTDTKIALITGANKGIGRRIAAGLAVRGMTVLVGARDPGRGKDAAEALRAEGGDAYPVTLDVTDPAGVRAAADGVAARFGRLDVLVNNAAIAGDLTRQSPGAADVAAVREAFETNVFGVITVTEAVLPLLRRSAAGRIVNLSSTVGSLAAHAPGGVLDRLPPALAYPVTKTALNQVTLQYARALRGTGILVNLADPGGCDTDLTRPTGLPVHRTAEQGAAIAVRLATLGPDGPTGGCFSDAGPVEW